MIIRQECINAVTSQIINSLNEAVYVKGGTEFAAGLEKELSGNLITIRVYLNEYVEGTIQGIRIKAGQEIWLEQMETFEKPKNRGFYRVYKINVNEVITSV